MGAVEVQESLGYYILVFFLCISVLVDAKSASSLETEDVVQKELSLLCRRYWP